MDYHKITQNTHESKYQFGLHEFQLSGLYRLRFSDCMPPGTAFHHSACNKTHAA
jgi:hypothetical protein